MPMFHASPIIGRGNARSGPFTWTLLARGIGLLALLTAFAAPQVATAAPSPAGPASTCAWPTAVSVATRNSGGPDSNAGYWLQSFVVQSTLRIVLSGRYPDARYASLSVYNSATNSFTRNGVGSALADYQIAPDPGSVNPWQKQAPPGGHFTVTLRADAAPNEVNTLPLAPAGTPNGRLGYLLYRIYVPAGGNLAAIPLPTLTFQQGRTSRTLLACAHPSAMPTATPGPQPSGGHATPTPTRTPAATAAAPKPLAFFRPAFAELFPDTDGAYLETYLFPPGPADVVVVTAKAPRTPVGDHPVVWPAPGEDMRYWSLCSGLLTELATVANPVPGGQTDYGCRDNDATKLDSAGYYFYVVGRESQRAAIERIPGVTFLPFSATEPTALHLLFFRDKLVNPGFAYAIQKVTRYRDPAAAAAATGPYYPRTAVCPLNTLTSKGVQACLAHP